MDNKTLALDTSNISKYDYKAKLAELALNGTLDEFREGLENTTYGPGSYDKNWAVSQYYAYNVIHMITQGNVNIPPYNPSILMKETKKFLIDLACTVVYGDYV